MLIDAQAMENGARRSPYSEERQILQNEICKWISDLIMEKVIESMT